MSPQTLAFWDATVKVVYLGDDGRKKLRMALINLIESCLLYTSDAADEL